MAKQGYDKYYKEENYFGNPYPGLQNFFIDQKQKGSVLDLGCGQGRDALFLGGLGYRVKGIDTSAVGINQLNREALKEKIDVIGEVGDIYAYKGLENYDYILMDSMLHFYKNDIDKETKLVKKVASELKVGGIICIFMIKGKKRESHLKNIISELNIKWEVLCDGYTNYPEANAEYHMYILKKMSE